MGKTTQDKTNQGKVSHAWLHWVLPKGEVTQCEFTLSMRWKGEFWKIYIIPDEKVIEMN